MDPFSRECSHSRENGSIAVFINSKIMVTNTFCNGVNNHDVLIRRMLNTIDIIITLNTVLA